jgi:hypothetical protein
MVAVSTSETSVNFYRLHGATSQKTVIFILIAVRTKNLTDKECIWKKSELQYSSIIYYSYSRVTLYLQRVLSQCMYSPSLYLSPTLLNVFWLHLMFRVKIKRFGANLIFICIGSIHLQLYAQIELTSFLNFNTHLYSYIHKHTHAGITSHIYKYICIYLYTNICIKT